MHRGDFANKRRLHAHLKLKTREQPSGAGEQQEEPVHGQLVDQDEHAHQHRLEQNAPRQLEETEMSTAVTKHAYTNARMNTKTLETHP